MQSQQAPPQSAVPKSIQQRIAVILFIAQSFFSASTIAAFTLSPIIAVALGGDEAAAGYPNTLSLVGRALFAYPFGRLMDSLGRRMALGGGYAIGVIGAIVSIWSVVESSYIGFLVGALLFGMARTSSDQARYVAAEVFPLPRRAQVIGWIVAAGTIGAIGGPLLVPPSGVWFEQVTGLAPQISEWAGPFGIAAVALLTGSIILLLMLNPDPLEIGRIIASEEAAHDKDSVEAQSDRSVLEIFAAPRVQFAVMAMCLGYFVMAFLMVITPVHMEGHGHHTVGISRVIMLHTLGMFGLSGLTGRMIDRFGREPMIFAGSGVLMLSAVLAPISLRVPILGLSLFLLGLGWNFAFVAGSSLLSDALKSSERARGQAASEIMVSLSAAVASVSVGSIFKLGDYLLASVVGFSIAALLAIAGVILMRRHRAIQQ